MPGWIEILGEGVYSLRKDASCGRPFCSDVMCKKAWHHIDLQDILSLPLLIVVSDLTDQPDDLRIDNHAVRYACCPFPRTVNCKGDPPVVDFQYLFA